MSQAFEFLLGQAKDHEEQAVLALNKAKAELDEYYVQVTQIEKYRLDYCQQLVDRGKEGLSASNYGHLNRFLTQLDETLSKQKEAEGHFVEQVKNGEAHWLETRKQRKSYEWMLEKKEAQRKKEADFKEQKQADEFTTLMFARRTGR